MSHYMTALAMRQTGLKPAAKIVLYWLADHHNGETGLCFPSLNTLAKECEMDVATVKRHLGGLEDLGLIERKQRHRENGSQTSTQYILRLDAPLAQNAPPPSAKCATPLAQNDTPLNLGTNNLGNKPTHPNGCATGKPASGFWNDCILFLEGSGRSNRQARSLLGKWRKDHGERAIRDAIAKARASPDPIAYIETALRPKPQQRTTAEVLKGM